MWSRAIVFLRHYVALLLPLCVGLLQACLCLFTHAVAATGALMHKLVQFECVHKTTWFQKPVLL